MSSLLLGRRYSLFLSSLLFLSFFIPFFCCFLFSAPPFLSVSHFASSSLKSFKTIFKKAGLYSAFQRRNSRTTHTHRRQRRRRLHACRLIRQPQKSERHSFPLSSLLQQKKSPSHTRTREQSPITINPKWGRSLALSSKCLQFF